MVEEDKKIKVIVFGGAGFLGSHVVDTLTDKGYQVVIFDLKKSPYLKEGQVSIVGDITNQKAVEEAMRGCQIVYNFAAIADIDEASVKPLDTVRYNILGNTILLEAARKNNIERFVFASTLYVYSKTGSFYRSSKQACESLIEEYQNSYGLNYTILRYGSLYGPRAEESNWIHRILKQAIVEDKITRGGNGEELREYIHSYDAARLSVDALSDEYKNQCVIITGNQSIKVKDSLKMIKEIFNNQIELEFLPQATLAGHYEITPYNFTPKLAKRIQSNSYVDFGQGILSLINELYQKYTPSQENGLCNQTKAVVFDFDGVILESFDIKTKAFAFLFKDYPEYLEEIIKLHKGHGGMSRFEKFEIIYRDILGQPLSKERKQELGKQFSEYVYQEVLESPFVEGAKEFLEKYYQKISLFVASGTPEEELRSIVKERGLDKYFKGVFGIPLKKKDITLKIMEESGFNPKEVVFVGDAIEDYQGAKEAGVRFIGRITENNPFGDLQLNGTINNLSNLENFI